MRGAFILTLVLVGSVLLSGCSDGDGDGTTSTTTKTGTTSKITTTRTLTQTNTTSLPPNLPPVLVLSVQDAGGNKTPVTLVGGSLTFSAEGSKDQDSDGLHSIAIVLQDSNRTYPPGVLFGNGKFLTATYSFDRPGPVNVTASALDARGDRVEARMQVYVNQAGSTASRNLAPTTTEGGAVDAKNCHGPAGEADTQAVDNVFWDKVNVPATPATTFVVATITAGTGHIALCAPDGTAISESGTAVTSAKGTVFVAPPGGASYFVSVYNTAPGAPAAVTVAYEVHYEPQP